MATDPRVNCAGQQGTRVESVFLLSSPRVPEREWHVSALGMHRGEIMDRSITGLRWLGVVLLLLLTWGRSAAQCGPSTTCPSLTRVDLYDIPNDPKTIPHFFGGEAAGIALDPVNHLLYFAENPFDQGYAAVVQLDLTGKQGPVILQPPGGFGDVTALTFYAGKLYAADGNGYENFYAGGQPTSLNVVWQYDPANTGTNGGWSQVVTGVNNPTGLAFDSGQDLYVSSWTDQAVYRYPYDSQSGLYDFGRVVFWTVPDGTAAPYGLAFDQGGNLYIAGFGGGTYSGGTKVLKWIATGTVPLSSTLLSRTPRGHSSQMGTRSPSPWRLTRTDIYMPCTTMPLKLSASHQMGRLLCSLVAAPATMPRMALLLVPKATYLRSSTAVELRQTLRCSRLTAWFRWRQ